MIEEPGIRISLWHQLKHRLGLTVGRISHDERGIYWECSTCLRRLYIEWREVWQTIKVPGVDG